MNSSRSSILKIDALYVAAALSALALTAVMTVRADDADMAAPAPAVAAEASAPADLSETVTQTIGQGDLEIPHSGARHSAD